MAKTQRLLTAVEDVYLSNVVDVRCCIRFFAVIFERLTFLRMTIIRLCVVGYHPTRGFRDLAGDRRRTKTAYEQARTKAAPPSGRGSGPLFLSSIYRTTRKTSFVILCHNVVIHRKEEFLERASFST